MPGARKLGRTSDQRKAMLRAMVTYLLENGKTRNHCIQEQRKFAAMTDKDDYSSAKPATLHFKASDSCIRHQGRRCKEALLTR